MGGKSFSVFQCSQFQDYNICNFFLLESFFANVQTFGTLANAKVILNNSEQSFP